MHLFENSITVGARSSPLSKVQVQEVLEEISLYHPDLSFTPVWMQTSGDKDKVTSLRSLEKTDFFTKELDQVLVSKQVRISIHSAKDLPDPLHDELEVVAITKGQDPSDVLVVREGVTLEALSALAPGIRIATSSIRREEEVKKLLPHAVVVDIRGNIEERLEKLFCGDVDAVVIAKAALIRLKLNHVQQIPLTENSAPLQGKLAVVARKDDHEMRKLFSSIDTRPCMLYLGLEIPAIVDKRIVHLPLIQTKMRKKEELEGLQEHVHKATHIILTSKCAVRYFFNLCADISDLLNKEYIAVGKETAQLLKHFGVEKGVTSSDECQEGIIAHIEQTKAKHHHYVWPHSNLSRRVLPEFLQESAISFSECILYDTTAKKPSDVVCFDAIDEIFFSSPSTVDAFFSFFGPPPKGKKLLTQGAVTERHLQNLIDAQNSAAL